MEGWAGLPAYSQVSMSAEASFPVAPKWILMNFPWGQMGQRVRDLARRDRVRILDLNTTRNALEM